MYRLVTPHLWRLLALRPPAAALFARVVASRPQTRNWNTTRRHIEPLIATGYIFLVALACCGLVSAPLHNIGAILVLLLIIFNGSLYGLGWALSIAGQIAVMREHGAWELLCITPPGTLGVVWAFAGGILHRDNRFRIRYDRHRAILQAAFVILFILWAGMLVRDEMLRPSAVVAAIAGLGALAAVYVDYVHSITLGVLVGVLAASGTRTRFDAQVLALGGYLLAQTFVYVVAMIGLLLVVLPNLSEGGWLAHIALLVGWLALFAGLREAIIAGAWRLITTRLNIDPAELPAPQPRWRERAPRVHPLQ
jgi:hypothetical protein